MAIFGPKPWVNPFGKMSIFRPFGTSCFYSLERRFFDVEYRKRHFPCLYWLKKKVGKMAIFVVKPWKNGKKKVGKMAIFGPKPWVDPLGKMSIFLLFEVFVFIA